ncbi:MAG TPA: gliding motility-associated C-terminal domain-containing protein, partial [Bacteroidia bacterium]|nr:gliding motility-associated C-terminal domain-containing protein [Bacteroidia bacterium]
CSSYTTVNLLGFNYSLPSPVIVATTTVCVNAMINLQASGGASYAWSGPEGFVSTSNMISFLALNTGMSGTYTLTVTNSSFCAGSNTVYIQVNPLPEASLQSTYNKLCVPFCTDFTLVQTNTSLGLQSVQYYIEGKVYSGPSAKACIKTPGNQAVYAIYTDLNGCSNNASLSITAFEKPKADFEYFPIKPVAGVDEVTFYNRSLGNNISSWSWYFISGDSLLGEKQVYRFEEAGSYPVALLVSNSFNCYDTIVKVVQVEDDFALYVPNAFTPNADGLNDLFRPVGTGLKAYKIEIYNRWGKTIYVSEDFFEGWDGTFQGELCKEDVYSFKIECTKTGGKTYNTSGWLMLER